MVQQPPGPPPGGMQPPPPPPPGQPPQAPMGPAGPPRPQFDTSNLPIADIVVAASALLVTIFSGIGWYGGEGYHRMGAMGALGLIMGILILLFAGTMVANKFLNFLPMELPTGLIYLGGAALVLVFLIVGIFVKPSIGVLWYVAFKLDVAWAMWILTLIFDIGVFVGGFLKMNESK